MTKYSHLTPEELLRMVLYHHKDHTELEIALAAALECTLVELEETVNSAGILSLALREYGVYADLPPKEMN